MEAAVTKARAPAAARAAPPITLNDVLVALIFFGTTSCLTLLFIKLAA